MLRLCRMRAPVLRFTVFIECQEEMKRERNVMDKLIKVSAQQ